MFQIRRGGGGDVNGFVRTSLRKQLSSDIKKRKSQNDVPGDSSRQRRVEDKAAALPQASTVEKQ